MADGIFIFGSVEMKRRLNDGFIRLGEPVTYRCIYTHIKGS